MIREFNSITEKDLKYMNTHRVTVTEKLNLVYFKVIVTDVMVCVVNTKNNPITEVDCVVNSVYKGICDFVDSNIRPKHSELLSTVGCCEICFFYKPVEKPYVIAYPKIDKQFIIGNLYTTVKKKNDIYAVADIIGDVDILEPICQKERMCVIDDINDSLSIAEKITDGVTWSGNDIKDIEGLILSSGKLCYKITINDTELFIDKYSKKIYRDTLLENFCSVMYGDRKTDEILDGDGDYFKKVCDLFLEYINKTSILSKMVIEDVDLLPPNYGYIGEIDFDKLPSTVRIICKNNGVYKNILRILLITFNKGVIENKFKDFQDSVRKKLNDMMKRLNSK